MTDKVQAQELTGLLHPSLNLNPSSYPSCVWMQGAELAAARGAADHTRAELQAVRALADQAHGKLQAARAAADGARADAEAATKALHTLTQEHSRQCAAAHAKLAGAFAMIAQQRVSEQDADDRLAELRAELKKREGDAAAAREQGSALSTRLETSAKVRRACVPAGQAKS